MWICSKCGTTITLSGFGEMKSDKCPKCGIILANLHNKHEYSKWLNYAFFQFWCCVMLAWFLGEKTEFPNVLAYVLILIAIAPYITAIIWSIFPEIVFLDKFMEKLVNFLVLPARLIGNLIISIGKMFLRLIKK
ncbi:MAG: hypothetical protein A2X59_06620 [Nitrospirae bacterium GWC2_42_7]|nr:MAG: hypothetical protein A2X59_06620 [Nitrospirae bacterium GWC2_42_7]